MFKLSWIRPRSRQVCHEQDWWHDPLGHPAVREMSLRELADLPLVAEVPMRRTRVEVTEDRQRRVSRLQSAGCAVSR